MTKRQQTTRKAKKKPQAKPTASKKPRATAANKRANAEKRAVQTSKAAVTPPKKKSASTISPPKRKNISQTILNGTLVHTRDNFLFGSDGKSEKNRMGAVVDSNRKNEIAIVKYTTSEKNGTLFENDKGFKRYGNRIYTKDNEGNPLILTKDGKVIKHINNNRDITPKQANQIKKANLQDNKYKESNRSALRKLKGRKNKK